MSEQQGEYTAQLIIIIMIVFCAMACLMADAAQALMMAV